MYSLAFYVAISTQVELSEGLRGHRYCLAMTSLAEIAMKQCHICLMYYNKWSRHLEEMHADKNDILSARIVGALAYLRVIESRNDTPDPNKVSQLTEPQLLCVPNFGKKSLRELRKWLAYRGMEFRPFR